MDGLERRRTDLAESIPDGRNELMPHRAGKMTYEDVTLLYSSSSTPPRLTCASPGAEEAVNVDGLGDIFQAFAAEPLQPVAISQAAYGLRAD